MKKITYTILTAVLFVTLSYGKNSYKIFVPYKGTTITLDSLVKISLNYDVIFFGEFHDDTLIHKLEIEFLKKLHAAEPMTAVSMEMFERDVQPIVDRYLSGKVTEKQFLDSSRPWPPSYSLFYKPIVDFAKTDSLPLIAANIPRTIASQYTKSGMAYINSLPPYKRAYVAKNINVNAGQYKNDFYDEMLTGMLVGWGITSYKDTNKLTATQQKSLLLLYGAQVLKDETMAESIYNFITINKNYKKLIHYNGCFHSDARMGTVAKLHDRDSSLKVMVISPQEGNAYDTSMNRKGDFILMIGNFPQTNINNVSNNNTNINIYPNPAQDAIKLSNELEILSFDIFNIFGQSIVSQSHSNNNAINISNLPKGLYVIELKTTEGISRSRFIKQ